MTPPAKSKRQSAEVNGRRYMASGLILALVALYLLDGSAAVEIAAMYGTFAGFETWKAREYIKAETTRPSGTVGGAAAVGVIVTKKEGVDG